MRKLTKDEIECRVAQVTPKGCTLLLYKTARVDRAILDEEFGQFGWQNDFKVIDGKMYGGIGIYSNDLSEWLWRWDCGVESNTEAEKGQASDAFKRAGFKWGIGVELYTAPFIFVQCETVFNKDKHKYEMVDKYAKFKVDSIGYSDNGEINKLSIINSNNDKVFELGKYTPKKKTKPKTSDKDLEFLEVVAAMDNIADLKEYYASTKELVDDRQAYHQLVCDRIKAIKGEE